MGSMTLQDIADRMEIEDVLTRYATAVDTKDWDLYTSCFVPDAAIDYTSSGGIKGTLPEVKAWLAQIMPTFPMSQHIVTNKVIKVTGDTATCRSYLFNPMALPEDVEGMILFFEGGYYNDKLVRTRDGWRIAERVEESAYTTRLHRMMEPA